MEIDIGMFGYAAALGLAASGSAMGTGAAGQAAVGAWKKCFLKGKSAPFMLIAFVGAPLTQTIYGFVLMKALLASSGDPVKRMAAGILGGLAMGSSAYMQGRVSAASCDALAETGKGTGSYFMAVGIVETVALFAMALLLMAV